MKKIIIIILVVFGLVACSNDTENSERIKSLESKLKIAHEQIEEKENEITKLQKEKIEFKRNIQELQKTGENDDSSYYEEEEVRSEGDERLKSYDFIIKGISNRISQIDELLKDGEYNDEQIELLEKEREFVWQHWLDWKDKQTELMGEMEYIDG